MRDLAVWPMVSLTGCFSLSKSNATTSNQNGECLAERLALDNVQSRIAKGQTKIGILKEETCQTS